MNSNLPEPEHDLFRCHLSLKLLVNEHDVFNADSISQLEIDLMEVKLINIIEVVISSLVNTSVLEDWHT